MEKFAWVCLAGALGTGTRYLVTLGAQARWGPDWPIGTFLVNVVGCFLIALLSQVALQKSSFSPDLRVILATGFVGGLTTYSSFSYETMRFARLGQTSAALVYFLATTLVCFLALFLGDALARATAS